MPIRIFNTFDDPSALGTTNAYGFNNTGQIVGSYLDVTGTHGFFYNPNGGTYTIIDDTLATQGTVASGISTLGKIVGYYLNASGIHGFLFSGGVYTPLDVISASPALLLHSASTARAPRSSVSIRTPPASTALF